MDIGYAIEDIMRASDELVAVKITLLVSEWLLDQALSHGMDNYASFQKHQQPDFLAKVELAFAISAIGCGHQLGLERVQTIRNRVPLSIDEADLEVLTMYSDKRAMQRGPYAERLSIGTKAMVAMGMMVGSVDEAVRLFNQDFSPLD